MRTLNRLFERRRRYADISASIQEHIQERTEELMDDGVPRDEAEQAARREFGNVTLIQERSREMWQWSMVESILADLKLTFRRLRKSPGFAATILLTLAIGIGANTAVFSVLNSVLLKPLPYPDADRLVSLWLNAPGAAGLSNFISGLHLSSSMYFTFAEHNQTFESLGVWTRGTANVTGLARPEEVHTGLVSDGVLQSLQVQPAVGRWLTPADQDPHGSKAVMLSYGYWQRRFGGDPFVVGRNITVDAVTKEIVGVMPRGFRLIDQDFDLLVPLAFDRNNQKLAGFGFDGIGRLKPGITLAQANADIARLIPVWMDTWTNGPGTNPHFYEIVEDRTSTSPVEEAGDRQCGQLAVGGDGDRCAGDAHRLHKRGESVAGPRGLATAGAFDSFRAWRGAHTHCTGTAGRERVAWTDGRSALSGCGLCRSATSNGDGPGRSAAPERSLH